MSIGIDKAMAGIFFISYARKDQKKARRIAGALAATQGWSV